MSGEGKAPVVVVGGGVMGFTSALRLLQAGFSDVSLVAERFAPIPSKSSPAVFRPAWLGQTPHEKVMQWGHATAKELARLVRAEGSSCGVTACTHVEIYKEEAGPEAALPDPALKKVMPGFRAATELELDTFAPNAKGGWVYSTFIIEGTRFLKYLEVKAVALGLQILPEQKVEGAAQSEEWCRNAILAAGRPDCRLVVNCMGINGGPECYPIRGDLVLVRAPYVRVAIAEYNSADHSRPTYIYPRRDHVVLGSMYLEGDGDREERPETTADVIERCAEFIPELRSAPMVGVVPCIRPGRKAGVRLDRIRSGEFHVVNDYGHGGGGMGTSWGCAEDVVKFCEEAFLQLREESIQSSGSGSAALGSPASGISSRL